MSSSFTKKRLKNQTFLQKTLRICALCFLIIWGILGAGALIGLAYEKQYHNKVYRGIILGQTPVDGYTKKMLRDAISDFQKKIEVQGIIFMYKKKEVRIFPHIISPGDPDLAYDLFVIHEDETIHDTFSIGRSPNVVQNFLQKLSLMRQPMRTPLSKMVSEEMLLATLKENFSDVSQPSTDARLIIDDDFSITIIPEEFGLIPDYSFGIRALNTNLDLMSQGVIVLPAIKDEPRVTADELSSQEETIKKLFNENPELILRFDKKEWRIPKKSYKQWITVQNDRPAFSEGMQEYIKTSIAPDIEKPVQEARFQISDSGKVTEFKPSSSGLRINYENILENINKTFFSSSTASTENLVVEIETDTVTPRYTTEEVNSIGIKEIIGVGKSNFAGSPANRRHNIQVGADTLNGILIPPGEEFSLIQALGEIDAENGYLPELVIKGNRTIPEFGGGLCQIGTTLFRAALQSGLDITERKSHSYRVRYYEPAGMDCTIYTPHPDCRFINDTPHHILIQTYMTEKDDLIFEFWGTKDGRNVTITDPRIYNIVNPPPTKLIETEDMNPGEKKCTERAHKGAQTDFDYTVTYPDGTKSEETFYSTYRPWQEVCLVGKEKTNEENTDATAENQEAPQSNAEAIPMTP